MERGVSADYPSNRATGRPPNPIVEAKLRTQDSSKSIVAAALSESETNGWVVLGTDKSYFRERLIAFDYTPSVTPTKLVEALHLESRAQLDELISAGIQGLWDDLPTETRNRYKDAKVVSFSADIDPLLIIQRGKRALAQRRKEDSLRAASVERALRVEPRYDYDDWKVRDTRQHSYQASFAEVLHGRTLSGLTTESKQRTRKAFVLDLMGYGQVLRGLSIDGGLAVALGDPRSEADKQWGRERNIEFIEGNILRRSAWNKMQRWIDLQGTDDKKFDLILCRAVRGLDDLTDKKEVHIILLQRAWQMLSPNGGTLLTQIQEHLFDEVLVNRWVRLLNQTEGVRADYSYRRNPACEPIAFRPVLSLVKSEGAPEKLPLLKSD